MISHYFLLVLLPWDLPLLKLYPLVIEEILVGVYSDCCIARSLIN